MTEIIKTLSRGHTQVTTQRVLVEKEYAFSRLIFLVTYSVGNGMMAVGVLERLIIFIKRPCYPSLQYAE